jgi:chromosome partitioning protein
MKKPIIIAFGNRKGGVAKTTTVSSLAGYFIKRGFRVLVVDLDTQANLTTTFLKDIPDDTVTAIFEKKRIPIHHIRENLDLVAADADLVAVERILNRPDDRLILARALAVVKDKYDIILLDCPPSLSWLTINALSASDKLFVPMDMDKKSVDAVSKMAEVCYQSATPTKIDGIFFTKYEPRLNATKKVESLVRTRFGSTVMDVAIRKCSKIPESSLENTDVVTFAPNSNAAEDYQRLGDEILRIAGLVDGDGSKKA